jgi:hypothetical protein
VTIDKIEASSVTQGCTVAKRGKIQNIEAASNGIGGWRPKNQRSDREQSRIWPENAGSSNWRKRKHKATTQKPDQGKTKTSHWILKPVHKKNESNTVFWKVGVLCWMFKGYGIADLALSSVDWSRCNFSEGTMRSFERAVRGKLWETRNEQDAGPLAS